MNLYSLVLLDIGGTLVDVNRQISPNTKRLLNRLEQRGVPVALCSSGSPGEADALAREWGLGGPLVCYDGSLVLDSGRGILADTGIDGGTAVRFKRWAAEVWPDVAVSSWLYDVWLVDSVREAAGFVDGMGWTALEGQSAMGRWSRNAVEGLLEDAVRAGGRVHKMQCMGHPARLWELRAEAEPLYPGLVFRPSGGDCLDITSAGADRYTALDCLRRYYGVAAEQVAAVGNDCEDIPMLRGAGLGIAMGNASEAVRQAADRVTASNNQEGVYIALKNLRFRPPRQAAGTGTEQAGTEQARTEQARTEQARTEQARTGKAQTAQIGREKA